MGCEKSDNEIDDIDEAASTNHLLTLIHCLIMKHSGYTGHIMNLHSLLLLRHERQIKGLPHRII